VEPGGQLDMQQLLAAAAAMQNQLMNAQQELAEAEVEGTAGGGLVTATVNGQGELIDLKVSAAAIEAGDPEETAQTLSDLVLAAYRDACRAADDLQEEAMAPFAGMPDISSLTGLGLPGMPSAAAGPGDAPADSDAEDGDG
jgi:nucleoid-associated protein EbfC